MRWGVLDRAIAIWVCLIATWAVVFVCAGLAGLISENSSNIASWVQAIGAIFALFVASHQITRQLKHAEKNQTKKKLEDDLSEVIGCRMAAEDCCSALKSLANKISDVNKRPVNSSKQRIYGIEQTIRVLIGKPLPPDAINEMLVVLRELAYSSRAIEEGKSKQGSYRSKKALVRLRTVQRVVKRLAQMESEILMRLAEIP